jgi:hypothetical protein
MLRWLPGGRQLSYVVRDPGGAKARLVVVDLAGEVVREVAIRPPNPSLGGFRFVEELSWVSTTKVRVGGSYNPYNCERVDIDAETGRESNWQIGECGSLVTSPDGKHFAELGLSGPQPEAEKDNTVEIDCRGPRCQLGGVAYRGGGFPIKVLAGPMWLTDSSAVGVVEKRLASGETAVTLLSVGGVVRTVPVPEAVADHPSLVALGSAVVVGEGPDRLLIDRDGTAPSPPAPDVIEQIERLRMVIAHSTSVSNQTQQLMKRLGAREAVAAQVE